MKKIIISILLLALVGGVVYFGYTTFYERTPSKKETKSQLKTDFEPEIEILETLKEEDFDLHGDFPITLDTSQFRRDDDDPFATY